MAWNRWRVGFGVLALLGVAQAVAAQAQAVPAPAAPANFAFPLLAANTNNSSFAGLLGFDHLNTDAVQTTFSVPRLACTSTNRWMAVIDGVDSEQTADRVAWAVVDIACYGGKEICAAAFNFSGKATVSSNEVLAGNSMTLAVDESSTSTEMTITDNSRHWKLSQHDGYVNDDSFPVIVDQLEKSKGQSGPAQVPVFDHIVFTATRANGDKREDYPFSADNLTYNGKVKIATENSKPANREGFTLVYVRT